MWKLRIWIPMFGALTALASVATSASAGVYGTVWIEVDNSVGMFGEAAGLPTGLEGVRTFDLYAIVTPDTEFFAADFGFVSGYGYEPSMWTTQSVYQHEAGGDVRSRMVGLLRASDFAALEFDTYVGMGSVKTDIVRNTSIFGADWSPAEFKVVWFTAPLTDTTIGQTTPDEEGRIFLARISVESQGALGEDTSADEYLGGMLFVSGRDSQYSFGTVGGGAGMLPTRNAFEGSGPLFFEDLHDGLVSEPGDLVGDLNFDRVIDERDLEILYSAFGTMNRMYDLTGDGLIEVSDVWKMLILIDPANTQTIDFPTTAKERRKAQKRYQKTLRKAQKAEAKAEKRLQRQIRKTVRKALREQRRQERRERRESRGNAGG